MDADRFDAIAKRLAAGPASRRAALRALAGGALGGLLGLLDRAGVEDAGAHDALRRCKKIKDRQQRKRCIKKARAHNRRHCSVGPDGAVNHAAEARFDGQPLRVEQTVQQFGSRGETAGRMALTLGGAPLLTHEIEGAAGTVTVTVTYGEAFRGINQAWFTNDGTTIQGEIDGRAIEPLPADGDPRQARFADGGPPPEVRVDPELAKAIRALLQRAKEEAKACDPAPPAGGHVGAANRHPTQDWDCQALYLLCHKGFLWCIYGAATGCLGAGPFYPACFVPLSLACLYAADQCRRLNRHGPACCPVRCGGDHVLVPFGEEPGCCYERETCLNEHDSESECCPSGSRACHGRSCCQGFESCREDGQCCPAGTRPCGRSKCCRDGETCMRDGSCCPDPSVCGGASGACCRGTNCCPPRNVCCPAGQSCVNGQCEQVCSPDLHQTCPNEPGYSRCCPRGTFCCRSGQCCPRFAPTCCGDGCCAIGEECCPDNVCRTNCLR